MATLTKAHNQWATRPADERFRSVQELHNSCLLTKGSSYPVTVGYDCLSVQPRGEGEQEDLALQAGEVTAKTVGGLTECSQLIPHADERLKVDRAAGKLLQTVEYGS